MLAAVVGVYRLPFAETHIEIKQTRTPHATATAFPAQMHFKKAQMDIADQFLKSLRQRNIDRGSSEQDKACSKNPKTAGTASPSAAPAI